MASPHTWYMRTLGFSLPGVPEGDEAALSEQRDNATGCLNRDERSCARVGPEGNRNAKDSYG